MVGASEIWVGLLLMACENMGEKQKEIEGQSTELLSVSSAPKEKYAI